MNRSTPINLIKVTRGKDANGVERESGETVRTVFANVKSASAKEFHDGYRNGLNPRYVFTMFRYDYDNETVIEYDGARYGVNRTYVKGDAIELHAERKGGTNRVNHSG